MTPLANQSEKKELALTWHRSDFRMVLEWRFVFSSMEYLEKLKVYGDQVKNVMVKSMFDTACGGQKILKDVLPGNLVTREYEVIATSMDELSVYRVVNVLSLQLVQALGSAGPGLLWHIYGAIKRSTKQVELPTSPSPRFFSMSSF